MTRVLVLVGPHGSGKTTLGERVARALGWPFDPEIGARLRREALARDPRAHAALNQGAFDRRVWVEERARDRARGAVERVIETWHPGNLAYAKARSPEVAAALERDVAHALAALGVEAIVQPLTVSVATLSQRLREPGPEGEAFVPWLKAVGDGAAVVAEGLGLTILPTLPTDALSVDAAEALILARLRALPGGR